MRRMQGLLGSPRTLLRTRGSVGNCSDGRAMPSGAWGMAPL